MDEISRELPSETAMDGRAGGGEARDVPPLEDVAAAVPVVLGVLLAAREPLSTLRLAEVCNTTPRLVEQALERIPEQLGAARLPIELARVDGRVQLLTRPELFPYVQRLRAVRKTARLSPAALETLAVIAYRQPVMRAEIEAIRGVKVGPVLKTLLEHRLVRVAGRADVPGRPLQYGTTREFLDRFGLGSLDDLPSVRELKSLS